jgi:hypothetical protein
MAYLTISEVVNVTFDKIPKIVTWRNREIKIQKIGLHHTYEKGEILYHVFSVVSDTLFMKLELNTKNLIWKLEQISEYGI